MAGKKEKAPKEGGEGKGKSPILMIVIVLVAGLAGGVFVGKNMMGSKAPPEPKPPKVGSTVDLGEFLINLGEDSYLKVGVAIGLKEGIDGGHMKEEIPALNDAVLMAFAGRTKSANASTKCWNTKPMRKRACWRSISLPSSRSSCPLWGLF
jgi:flagellar basal body-associated protein FliL